MTVYTEDPKESKKKNLLELISDSSNSVGYKINTQRSITFLYSNNECVETN